MIEDIHGGGAAMTAGFPGGELTRPFFLDPGAVALDNLARHLVGRVHPSHAGYRCVAVVPAENDLSSQRVAIAVYWPRLTEDRR